MQESSELSSSFPKFSNTPMAINIGITPKLHAIFSHISDFCEKNKSALGIWSEQASKSVHANFKKT
ncbi:hypothetical protein A3Q56_02684 [Intoshia linei]|uniref:Uncharacterized protein n=1 Tax=Intoshia linei TaxID=1819745 RepID=A0A177B5N3_9BILA|nr:hypothetical protein A3Q56_02684 [Intoshia linei]